MLNNMLLANNGGSSVVMLVVLVILIVVMLVVPSITNKKRVQAYQDMQNRLRAGDKVQTIGGIVGKIVKIKESNGVKTVFIETGDKSNKMVIEFDMNAIAGVVEGIANPNANEPQVTETENAEESAETVDVSFDEPANEEKVEESTEQKTETKKKSSKSKK